MTEPVVREEGKCLLPEAGRLPRACGVYLFLSASGRVLYVGKAKCLRNRVRTHLTGRHRRRQRLRHEAVSLWYLVTETELDALLLEDDLIKCYLPPCNRAQKDYLRSVYVRVSSKEPYLSVTLTAGRDAAYFGPFADPWQVRETVDLLAEYVGFRPSLSFADVADRLTLEEKIRLVKAVLEGRDDSLYRRLVRRRKRQADLLVFEAAARTQRKIELLQRIQRWGAVIRSTGRPVRKEDVDKLRILVRYAPTG